MNRKDKIALLTNLKAGKICIKNLLSDTITILISDKDNGYYDPDSKQKFTAIEVQKMKHNPHELFIDL